MDPHTLNRKKESTLRMLRGSQDMGEGLTPGRLRAGLRITNKEMAFLLKEMVDEGLIAVLPPPATQDGPGRPAALIVSINKLRGPETMEEMIQSDFVPVPTGEPNPIYMVEKKNREEGVDLHAFGMEAVFAVVDQMTKLSMPFSIGQLMEKMTIIVPDYIVNFVWGRFTNPLFEETQLNGGFYFNERDQTLTRTGHIEPVSDMTSLQLAAYNSLTKGLSKGIQPRYLWSTDDPEHNAKAVHSLSEASRFGLSRQVIDHPRFRKFAGDRLGRERFCDEQDLDGLEPDHPFFGCYQLWSTQKNEDYKRDLLIMFSNDDYDLELSLANYEAATGNEDDE